MPDDTPASPEWGIDHIRKLLKAKAAGTGRVSANVFLHDSVSAEQLSGAVKEAIDKAAQRLGRAASVEIGKVHRLAKSVSVKGDPEVIAELSNADSVKTILPSEIEDIYPKPVESKPVR